MSIDLRRLAETALDAFPLPPDGMDPARDYAQRLLSKEIGRLGKGGEEIDSAMASAWRSDLDALLEEMRRSYRPKPVEIPPTASPSQPPPQPAPALDLEWLVADAFSAPYDGTPERRATLSARAMGSVEAEIEGQDFGWLQRWRLRRRARRLIARHAADLEAMCSDR